MFGWIKSLFGIGKKIEVQEVQVKTVAIEESKEKDLPQQPEFESMTKKELEAWALEHLEMNVDRRRKKDFIIDAIKTKLKEK